MSLNPDYAKMPEPRDLGWAWDKKLSLSLLVALVLQIVATVWWAATTDAVLQRTREDVSSLQQDSKDAEVQRADTIGRIIRLEEKVERGNDLLAQILQNLEQK